ncbi:MAG: SDR family NAD(P)-dependent oxidoreductase [Alphaproteobacteria bacterium]|nr:SDR family NAD(P)-dependent oxidoreductase [Alphaproteobacteria bacterium]
MARFLVTGGAGFIGSHLVHALLNEGHTVRVLDDLSSGHRKNLPQQVELTEADVTDPAAVESALEGVDGCFHLAAIASVARSHRDWLRTHQVNLTGTINVFDQARPSRRRRVIPVVYASTAAIYGNCGSFPVDEESPAAPLSAYGADKHACELHARVAGSIHGVPTVGLRFFNLYGPRQDPLSPYSGVISIFADRLLRGEPVEIFGDGEQARDFTYVSDAVCALRRAMRTVTTSASVFNVCTGKATSVRDLARIMAELCGTELVVRHRPTRGGEVRISIGDPRRAVERLGFTAQTTLSNGLAMTLNLLGRGPEVEARVVA